MNWLLSKSRYRSVGLVLAGTAVYYVAYMSLAFFVLGHTLASMDRGGTDPSWLVDVASLLFDVLAFPLSQVPLRGLSAYGGSAEIVLGHTALLLNGLLWSMAVYGGGRLAVRWWTHGFSDGVSASAEGR